MPGESGSEVVIGRRPILQALEQGLAMHRILVAEGQPLTGALRAILDGARTRGIPVTFVERSVLNRHGAHHQGCVALLSPIPYVEVETLIARAGEEAAVLLLDGIEDPQNLGAIGRSAEAFGAVGLILPRRRSAPVTPAAVKASAGALLTLPVARVGNLSQAVATLKEARFWVLAASPSGGRPLWTERLGGRVAFLVGSEDRGVSPLLVRRSDGTITIPQVGETPSLNASVAAALLLYEWRRQIQGEGR